MRLHGFDDRLGLSPLVVAVSREDGRNWVFRLRVAARSSKAACGIFWAVDDDDSSWVLFVALSSFIWLDAGCSVFSRKMRREGCRSRKESRRVPNREIERKRERDI
jgi:hypothetical protein